MWPTFPLVLRTCIGVYPYKHRFLNLLLGHINIASSKMWTISNNVI